MYGLHALRTKCDALLAAMADAGVVGQTREIVRLINHLLGSDLIGSYLYGSAVLGGLKPASDIDVLAVSSRRMDDQQRRALVAGLLTISGASARPVELTVVVQVEVRPWRYPPTGDFLYGEWLRAEFEAGAVPQPAPMPDLALLISMVLVGDHPLTGPPPARVLDPVPPADLARATVAGIPSLLNDLPADTRNVLLTLARIWTTLATGEIRAKDAAADWVLAQLPPSHRPVLEHARDLYLSTGYAEEHWPDALKARVPAYVAEALAAIERLSAGVGPGYVFDGGR